jgi:hypothetical protein
MHIDAHRCTYIHIYTHRCYSCTARALAMCSRAAPQCCAAVQHEHLTGARPNRAQSTTSTLVPPRRQSVSVRPFHRRQSVSVLPFHRRQSVSVRPFHRRQSVSVRPFHRRQSVSVRPFHHPQSVGRVSMATGLRSPYKPRSPLILHKPACPPAYPLILHNRLILGL